MNTTLDRMFFALSDPTRRGILERLGRGPATIGELARPFGLSLNGMKKHVGILEEVDLVVTAKVGHARKCQLGPAQLEATEWTIDALGSAGWTGSASRSKGRTADDEPGRAIRAGDQRPARRGV